MQSLIQKNNGGRVFVSGAIGPQSGTSTAIGYSSTTTNGSLLVAVCTAAAQSNIASPVTLPILSAPVTAGFTWVLAENANFLSGNVPGGGGTTSAAAVIAIYYISNAAVMGTGVHTTLAATVSNASSMGVEFSLYEFGGISPTSIDAIAVTNNGPTSTPPSTPNLTTTGTDVILVAVSGFGSAGSAVGAGYSAGVVRAQVVGQDQYQLNVSSGSIATAFGAGSNSYGDWGCAAVAFQTFIPPPPPVSPPCIPRCDAIEVVYESGGIVRLLTGQLDQIQDIDYELGGFGTEVAVNGAGLTTHAWGNQNAFLIKRPTFVRFNTNRDPATLANDGWLFGVLGIDDDFYTFFNPLILALTPGVNDTSALCGNPDFSSGLAFRHSPELFRIAGVNFVMGRRLKFQINFPSAPGANYQLRGIQIGFGANPPS